MSYSQLKTSILLVYFVVVALHYSTPYSFGVTASTQISNELGVENPNTTDLAAVFVMVLGVAKEIIISQPFHSENLVNRAKDLTSLYSKIDAEHQGLFLIFDSQLDQSSKYMHKITLGSVSQ